MRAGHTHFSDYSRARHCYPFGSPVCCVTGSKKSGNLHMITSSFFPFPGKIALSCHAHNVSFEHWRNVPCAYFMRFEHAYFIRFLFGSLFSSGCLWNVLQICHFLCCLAAYHLKFVRYYSSVVINAPWHWMVRLCLPYTHSLVLHLQVPIQCAAGKKCWEKVRNVVSPVGCKFRKNYSPYILLPLHGSASEFISLPKSPLRSVLYKFACFQPGKQIISNVKP